MHQELSNPVTILVDGKPIETEAGALLIDVLLQNGIAVPHFCYHEALGADGNCRMCMVGIKGSKRPQIACDTFVREGMEISTKDESILQVKRDILELELINHPVDCPICDQAGECKLQDYYMDYGLYESRLETPKTRKGKKIDLGSNVVLDQERCVLCARCTRFTQEITKTNELAIVGRGDAARVATAPGRELDNPYAMNVVDLCPVGALTSKDFRFRQRVWFLDSVPGICHGCAKGCNIWIDHNQPKYAQDKVYRYRPRVNRDVNGFFLCDEGRLSYKHQNVVRGNDVLAYGQVIDTDEAVSNFKQMVCEGKTAAVADASLSLEQLAAIKRFCNAYGISLYSKPISDPEFGDGWLRRNDRSANTASIELLEIETDEALLIPALRDADTVINFNQPSLLDASALSGKNVIQFITGNCENEAQYALVLPFASYALDEGSLINCDGRLQRFRHSLKQDVPHPTLLAWLHSIDSVIPDTNDEVWQRCLSGVPELANIDYLKIPAEGILLKGGADA
jgi:NADH-quinone oxidoreductase subunit G